MENGVVVRKAYPLYVSVGTVGSSMHTINERCVQFLVRHVKSVISRIILPKNVAVARM